MPEKDAVTLACEHLQSEIQKITTASGYLTNSGERTVSEFAGILIANNEQTPFVAIQPESTGDPEKATNRAKLQENLQLVLVVDATKGAATELRRGLADLRKCLHYKPYERALSGQISALQIGSSTYDITDDSRYALAILPVTLTIIENYED